MTHVSVPMFLVLALSSDAAAASIEGYAWPPSVTQGQPVGLYVSTDAASFDIEFVREGLNSVPYLEIEGVPGAQQAVPDSAWQGCDWDLSHSLEVPTDWPSGVYVARLVAAAAPTSYAVFVVKEDDPGSTSPILFQCSIATWQAYNNWGGKSLYNRYSDDGQRAYVVSFLRPYASGNGRGLFETWARPQVAWLETEGYAVEYCTDLDTHADTQLESAYELLMVAGHDEYWSKEIRDHVEARIASGRNVVFLGGNIGWWQIRWNAGLDRITCYKSAELDPLYGIQDSLVTVRWHEPPLDRPSNEVTGVSTRGGGYPRESMAYVVERAEHWAFEGTGISNGQSFGDVGVVAGEVDGAAFERLDGLPVVTGEDGTPLQFEILATASFTGGFGNPPYDEGTATMGVYEQGGTVFTASTLGWSTGLSNPVAGDPVTRRISENVIARTVDRSPFWSGAGDVVLDEVTWSTLGSNVTFLLSFRNTNPVHASRGIHGFLMARTLGDFLATTGPELPFDLPSIPASQTSQVALTFPVSDLPNAGRIHPPGSPFPGCPEDHDWAGGATVRWRKTGVSELTTETFDRGTLIVCPGAGPSYVRIGVECGDPAGTAWSITPPCSLWTASLLADSSGAPGGPAPDPIPPGDFVGWVAVSADSGVTPWIPCDLDIPLVCGADTGRVLVSATPCACQEPSGAPSGAESPTALRLGPSSPNPFSLRTRIDFELPTAAHASLRIYDVSGRLVRTFRNSAGSPGPHFAWWAGRDEAGRRVAPGLYLWRLDQGDRSVTRKVVLLR